MVNDGPIRDYVHIFHLITIKELLTAKFMSLSSLFYRYLLGTVLQVYLQ